jgi:hypothetical protein
MSKRAVRYRGLLIFHSFQDFFDDVLSLDGVTSVRVAGMWDRQHRQTSYKPKRYDPTTHEIKVDAYSKDGTQEFVFRVDPAKARQVWEYIRDYRSI